MLKYGNAADGASREWPMSSEHSPLNTLSFFESFHNLRLTIGRISLSFSLLCLYFHLPPYFFLSFFFFLIDLPDAAACAPDAAIARRPPPVPRARRHATIHRRRQLARYE